MTRSGLIYILQIELPTKIVHYMSMSCVWPSIVPVPSTSASTQTHLRQKRKSFGTRHVRQLCVIRTRLNEYLLAWSRMLGQARTKNTAQNTHACARSCFARTHARSHARTLHDADHHGSDTLTSARIAARCARLIVTAFTEAMVPVLD